MAVDPEIAAEIIKFNPGKYVVLYQLDLTDLGGSVYRFTPATQIGGTPNTYTTIEFDGDIYYPRYMEAEGFEFSGKGKLPRPKIKIGNLDGVVSGLCRDYQDLLYVPLTRIRTFFNYIDGQPGENPSGPNPKMPEEIWFISQKTIETNLYCEFTLQSYLERKNRKIPGRIVLRDVCPNTYRIWNGSSFDDSPYNPCPYDGSSYFKKDGTSTGDPAEDACSKTLSGCKLRFGDNNEIKFGGFPSVAKYSRYFY